MNKTVRTIISDDEPLARELLTNYLKHESDVEIVACCASGEETVTAIQETNPDLVLLDVQMPGMDGFEVLRHIPKGKMPVIIFVTGRDEFALKAFESNALDYLLKPFDRERLHKAISRAREEVGHLREGLANDSLRSLLESLKPDPKNPERLLIRVGGRIFFVKTNEIDWIESDGNYARIHVGHESHLLRETMNALAERLDASRFLRVHRSAIVNIDRIKELEIVSQSESQITLKDGTRIPMSRSYREKLGGLLKNKIG